MEYTQQMRHTAERLLEFLENSPTSFHAVDQIAARLDQAGFQELREEEAWSLEPGGRYYTVRNQSSIIAFELPRTGRHSFQIIASHSDSPSFKLKENPEMTVEDQYVKLNVESYGGAVYSSWFDRPLSIAGRLVVSRDGRIESRLVKADRDLVMIPSLAIHMNRKVNQGYEYNVQKDLLPLLGGSGSKGLLMKLMADLAEVKEADILGHDLFLYNRMKGTIWGGREEFISSGRLDDLQCAFAALEGFLQTPGPEAVNVCAVLDNEEVGSATRQGADSTFLEDVLWRISKSLGGDRETYIQALASSFMISADNAHGVHPNYADKTDPTNRPYVNGGVVIKYNASQKYTTDAISAAVFKTLCRQAKVPCQTFVNRSDMAGGSTLGNIANCHVSVSTVDIGLPQLSMHSCYETAGVQDTWYMAQMAKVFYSSALAAEGRGMFRLVPEKTGQAED